MNPREQLIDTHAHIPPLHALEGLTPEDAERVVPGAPHSIAVLVAHMSFWQEWFCKRIEGVNEPVVTSAATGWPSVTPGSWPDVHRRFVAGLEHAAALVDHGDQPITPAIDFPPLANLTFRGAIAHMAQHNSHHLGQVILLRQMMSRWPPPAGSWTW